MTAEISTEKPHSIDDFDSRSFCCTFRFLLLCDQLSEPLGTSYKRDSDPFTFPFDRRLKYLPSSPPFGFRFRFAGIRLVERRDSKNHLVASQRR